MANCGVCFLFIIHCPKFLFEHLLLLIYLWVPMLSLLFKLDGREQLLHVP